MTGNEPLERVIHDIQLEHKHLHTRLTALRDLAACSVEPLPAQAKRLGAELSGLRDQLAEHFRREETGGFLDVAVSRLPRLASALSSLEHEHGTLLAKLSELIQAASTEPKSPQAWKRMQAGVEAFIDQMLAHEHAENRILGEGFNEDLEIEE
jgi:iron-sulfur cluster repair protein YtfE (RIC family)